MTAPSMNKGLQSAALAKVQVAVRILEKALTELGSMSEQGKELMKALTALGKMVPPGSSSPGVEQTALHQLMMQQKQEQPEIARLRAMGGGGAPGGGAPPSPAPPQPSPMAA